MADPSPPTPSPPDGAAAGVAAGPSFADLGLREELLGALARLGYEEPTAIQAETIPPLLQGRDLVGQAATGTGKTAAFALPVLQRLRPSTGRPQALVLVPTRELAVQVSEAMYRYGRDLGSSVVPVYGGQPIGRQLHALSKGVDVVVATPGRARDHIARRSLPLDGVRTVVLDEADEMLDMGFAEDLEAILEATPRERQTVLFSATMPPRIAAIADRHLRDPLQIRIGGRRAGADLPGGSGGDGPRIRQTAYVVQRFHKPAALGRILDVEEPAAAIVFCRTRDEVDQLTETMNGRGYRAEALHGGMNQEQRDRVMARLRSGTAELLMATDVAARGLDIDVLTHVVNYDVPPAPEAYVHRIGRVGRAGRAGVAITLAEPREQRLLGNIERVTGQTITLAAVPTVADLRAKQVESTVDAVRAAMAADDADPQARPTYDRMLRELAGEGGEALDRVARAAVRLVHEAAGPAPDELDIPDARREVRPERRPVDRDAPRRGRERADTGGGDDVGRLYLSVGRKDGIRPHDLVGAIANETGLAGREIGPIRIAEHSSIVGVPAARVDAVIEALRGATIKGRRATVRRYVEHDRRRR